VRTHHHHHDVLACAVRELRGDSMRTPRHLRMTAVSLSELLLHIYWTVHTYSTGTSKKQVMRAIFQQCFTNLFCAISKSVLPVSRLIRLYWSLVLLIVNSSSCLNNIYLFIYLLKQLDWSFWVCFQGGCALSRMYTCIFIKHIKLLWQSKKMLQKKMLQKIQHSFTTSQPMCTLLIETQQ